MHFLIREKLDKLSGSEHPRWVWKARRNMAQLWRFRVTADYYIDKVISQDDAKQAVETAIIIRDARAN